MAKFIFIKFCQFVASL